jgi:alcohol dehydrogenase class IV
VWQQDAHSALRAAVIRRSTTPSAEALEAITRALDIGKEGRAQRDTQLAIADEIERIHEQEGMPTRVRELDVSKEDFPALAEDSVKVFNSNAGMRYPEQQLRAAMELLEAAW